MRQELAVIHRSPPLELELPNYRDGLNGVGHPEVRPRSDWKGAKLGRSLGCRIPGIGLGLGYQVFLPVARIAWQR